ncbi:MAG TPA: DUF4230 domain-containing protein [Anaerolineales bacterium]|nr:DUF4230 domain-containing protein [Anaerolineales bacterium]
MRNFGNKIVVIVSLLILVIVGWGAYAIIRDIRKATGDLVSPVNALGTQSAELLNPTPTIIPDPVTVIYDVRSLSRLETIHYSLEKVITAQSNQGDWAFLFGDKLLFVAHGEVIAGIDLENLDPEDLELRDGTLYVNMPDAEVFVATLDNDKSYVYNRETGLLTEGDVNLETTARQAAEDAILEAALEDGILDQAEINAENYLVRLFRSLGYPEVIFVKDSPAVGE